MSQGWLAVGWCNRFQMWRRRFGIRREAGFCAGRWRSVDWTANGWRNFCLGVPLTRKITTAVEAGVGRWRFARFGGSAVQVKGFVGGVGRSALSGGGAGAYWVSSDAEHLAMGQGANAGFVRQQVVVTFYKLELKDGKRVA